MLVPTCPLLLALLNLPSICLCHPLTTAQSASCLHLSLLRMVTALWNLLYPRALTAFMELITLFYFCWCIASFYLDFGCELFPSKALKWGDVVGVCQELWITSIFQLLLLVCAGFSASVWEASPKLEFVVSLETLHMLLILGCFQHWWRCLCPGTPYTLR